MTNEKVIFNIIERPYLKNEIARPIESYSYSSVLFLRQKLLHWGRNNLSYFPWRVETSYLHALIAEILLQRTRAEQVAIVYSIFKVKFPTAKTLAEAPLSDIEATIHSLGLSWRAKSLLELGKKVTELNGIIPTDRKQLLNLPGVGPYVASAFLSFHMGVRAYIVDSNVIRFYGRYFGFTTNPETRRERSISELSDQITPVRSFKQFNYALIDFCRTICKPKPKHNECPLGRRCAEITH